MADSEDKTLPDKATALLLEAGAGVDPGADAVMRIRASLFQRVGVDDEGPSDGLVTVSRDSGEWLETGPGNLIKVLRSDDDTMSMLVRLDPGTTFPQHYHPADEETYVIEGETWFGDVHLVAGDYHLAPKGTTHGEVRTETGCVLLIRKASE